jgi:hypothetical protein
LGVAERIRIRMPIFAVLADKPNPALGAELEKLYPGQVYILTDSQWLLNADSIAQTVSNRLELKDGKYDRVLVIQASTSAAGWHKKTVWEWLGQKASS